jgi:FkbM family methyltransferase
MMTIIKRQFVRMLHRLGFDLVRVREDIESYFSGIDRLSINTVIDVGANRGQFAKKALSFFPKAHIYCFEPGKKSFADLKKWADGQNGRISVFETALGDKEADLNFYEYPANDEGSSFLRVINPVLQEVVIMHQTTMDNFIVSKNISLKSDVLVKIDTQGYDNKVIMGAKQTLSKAAACITEIMFDKEYEGQGSFKEIFSLLDELGFKFSGNREQHFSENGAIAWADAIFKK